MAEQKRKEVVIALLQQRLEDREQGTLVTPPPGSYPAGMSKPTATWRHEKSHQTPTEEQTGTRHRSALECIGDHRVVTPKRKLASIICAESSTRSSGSIARSFRSGASAPTLTLARPRAAHSKGKTRLDIDINCQPCREGHSRPHLDPRADGSRGHH